MNLTTLRWQSFKSSYKCCLMLYIFSYLLLILLSNENKACGLFSAWFLCTVAPFPFSPSKPSITCSLSPPSRGHHSDLLKHCLLWASLALLLPSSKCDPPTQPFSQHTIRVTQGLLTWAIRPVWNFRDWVQCFTARAVTAFSGKSFHHSFRGVQDPKKFPQKGSNHHVSRNRSWERLLIPRVFALRCYCRGRVLV